jgi:UDP-N-acetylglucosamine 2-epimerase (non-hydrolysing)
MILICYGTRPEWIKVKPVINELRGKIPCKVLFTGQHEHIGNFYHDYSLKVENRANRLDSIIAAVSKIDNKVFDGIEYVLVQGDTASTFAMALCAYNRKKKVIHLEAGLRTYDLDNPYPEEGYRQMISRIASIHLCATENNKVNLISEKAPGQIFVVGNTVLDNLVGVNTNYGDEVLVTMHRRENHDIMHDWFSEINKIAEDYGEIKFTIPLHPNPNVQKHKGLLSNLNIIEPLSYDEMVKRIANCKMLISDSGGIQEESSFLNKKVIVCRKYTERQESVGTHSIMCPQPSFLRETFDEVIKNYKVNKPCPYGDGYASRKILKTILGDKK